MTHTHIYKYIWNLFCVYIYIPKINYAEGEPFLWGKQ